MPRGLTADDIRRLLAVVPDTSAGLRDRAIILTLVLTGRRRAEVLGLKVGDLTREGDAAYYSYRGKGGKTGRRGATTTGLRRHTASAEGLWEAPGNDGADGVALAGQGLGRHHLGHVLPKVAEVAEGGWAAALGRSCFSALSRQVAAGRGRDGRGGEPVLGPQLAGGDQRVPAAARRAGRQELGEGGRGDWGLAFPLGSSNRNGCRPPAPRYFA